MLKTLVPLGLILALSLPLPQAEARTKQARHHRRPSCPAGTIAKNCGKTSDVRTCMTCNAYREAIGEGLIGMIMVDRVAVTRARSGRYPRSICSVIYQPDAFSWTSSPHTCVTNAGWRLASKAAEKAMKPNGKLFYHANYVKPRWARYCTGRETLGNHIFYSDCYTRTQWASVKRKTRSQYASAKTHTRTRFAFDDEGSTGAAR